MFYFMYLKWVPGPNLNLCVEASPHQKAILRPAESLKFSSILTGLSGDSIIFHRQRAKSPRLRFRQQSQAQALNCASDQLRTNWKPQ